jgi:hypothetical protein
MDWLARFEAKYIPEPNSGCWVWTGALSTGGYGMFRKDGKTYQAHRLSYELYKDRISTRLEIDHLCRVRCCVNPDHLEPVTKKVNAERGISGMLSRQRQLAKTHCPQGHLYDIKNTYIRPNGGRGCKQCLLAASNKYRAAHIEKCRKRFRKWWDARKQKAAQ